MKHLYQTIRRPQDAGDDLNDTFLAIADCVQAIGELSANRTPRPYLRYELSSGARAADF